MMTRKTQSLALVLCLALSSCTSNNPPTFITYVQKYTAQKIELPVRESTPGKNNKAYVSKEPGGYAAPQSKAVEAYDVTLAPRPTDALALNYANYIETMFRRTATGARFTREGSETALAGLSGAVGGAKVLAIGATGASTLGLASGGIVALRTIFDAKGRATAYSEAAERIHAAIKDYGAYNLNDVSKDKLTPNGWTLVNVVQSNIDIVTKILNGHLPTPQDLEQASEPMSKAGARIPNLGDAPVNNIPSPTLGDPAEHRARVQAFLDHRQAEGPKKANGEVKKKTPADLPTAEEVNYLLRLLAGPSNDVNATVFLDILRRNGVDPTKIDEKEDAQRVITAYTSGKPDAKRAILSDVERSAKDMLLSLAGPTKDPNAPIFTDIMQESKINPISFAATTNADRLLLALRKAETGQKNALLKSIKARQKP